MEGSSSKKSFDISKYYPFFFTIIFVLILFQYSFSTLEAIFYDIRVKYDFGTRFKDNIVLITLDEESDEFLGETYPYTYVSHRRLIEKLVKDKPLIINYLISFNEPSSDVESSNLKSFKNTVERFVQNDGIFRIGTEMDSWGEQLPPSELLDLGYSLALINIDNSIFAKDDISRRAILSWSGEDSLHIWTANQYRKSKKQEELSPNNILGSYYDREADSSFALYRYYTSPLEGHSRIKTIPFHRARVGNFPKGFFTNKIVLIGQNYISNGANFALTPFNKEKYRAPKIKLHAQIIQALVQRKTVYKIPEMVTYIISILIAVFLSITISKVKPTHGLLITVVSMLGILLLSYLIFCFFGMWLYVTHVVLTVFVVYYIWVPFRAIGEYQRRFAIQEESKLIKKVEDLKQNFISLMSHDLKTPVAKIQGLADIVMIRGKDCPELGKNMTSIIDSTKELNNFITSILDLTKVESRNFDLNMSSKDINPIIEGIVDSLQYQAKDQEVEVEVELAPLYPIKFDIVLMKRVLSNLIENAIKYSGKSSIVSIKSWDDDKWVYIDISDNGVGIGEDDIAHIFDKFYRVKNDASHSIKGTGLGLYLVKYFVELHGGKIVADSVTGEGTTFKIKLKNE